MKHRPATFYYPMPTLGTARKMELYNDGYPKPVTDELRKLHPLIMEAGHRFKKERDEFVRLTTLYCRLCEEYSNGLDSRFSEFLENLIAAEWPPTDEN